MHLDYPLGLLLVGGVPGAGKSTMLDRALNSGVLRLDPDRVAAEDGVGLGDAVDLAVGRALRALRDGAAAVLECRGVNAGLRRHLTAAAAEAGLPAHALFVDCDPRIARGRSGEGHRRLLDIALAGYYETGMQEVRAGATIGEGWTSALLIDDGDIVQSIRVG